MRETNTIRTWLDGMGFDWERGTVLVWQTTGYSPGWSYDEEISPPEVAERDHELLTHEFYSGYGSPQCPRFFAKDSEAVYFPTQYDGATGICRVVIDPQWYLDNPDEASPYPGG